MAGRLRRPPLICIVAIGIVVATLTAVKCQSDEDALRILKSKKLDELQAILSKVLDSVNETEEVTTRDPRLTGDPRKDYIYDPNLPRELGNYNLTNYPFYSEVPKDINFTCSGKLDGYYASVPHHCQLFHLCVFGHRHDFLCANYTVFDQSQFICHFVNSVNCSNSEKHYERNSELYVTTTTEAPYDDYDYAEEEEKPRRRRPQRRRKNGRRKGGKRRRTTTTTLSPDEYYYDYEDTAAPHLDEEQPPEEEPTTTTERIKRPAIRPPRPVLRTTTAQAEDVVEDPTEKKPTQRHSIRQRAESPVETLRPAASTRSRIPASAPEDIEQNDQPAPAAARPPRKRAQPKARPTTTTEYVPHDPMFVVNPDAIIGNILSGAGAVPAATPPPTTTTTTPASRPLGRRPQPSTTPESDIVYQPSRADIIGGILSGTGASQAAQPQTRRPPQPSRSNTNTNTQPPSRDEIVGGILSGIPAQPAAPSRQSAGRNRQRPAALASSKPSIPSDNTNTNDLNNRAGTGRRSRLEVATPQTGGSNNANPLTTPSTSSATGSGRIRVLQRVRKPVATTPPPQPPAADQEFEYVE